MLRAFATDKDHFLLQLERIQDRAATAHRQITSGYRVNKPSDDPARLMDIVDLQSKMAGSAQSMTNLQMAKSEVDLNEATLRQAVQMMQDIVVAGGQGVNATASPEDRKVVAARIQEWHSSLVRIANQDLNGRYQFGGDRDDIPPYSVDWTQPGGVVRAHNEPNTLLVEDAAGNRFSISRRAQDIFDLRDSTDGVASGNIFHAVHTLSVALEANDPDAAMDAIGLVKTAAVHLNNELSTYGVAQTRVNAAIEQARQVQLRATTQLAGIREADLPAAILELTQSNTNLDAALASRAQISRTNLFDYLG